MQMPVTIFSKTRAIMVRVSVRGSSTREKFTRQRIRCTSKALVVKATKEAASEESRILLLGILVLMPAHVQTRVAHAAQLRSFC